MVKKEAHLELKAYTKQVLKKGFQRPSFIPVYIGDALTTFRGSEEERNMPKWKRRRKTVVSEVKDPLEGLMNISIDNIQTMDIEPKGKVRKAVSRPKSTSIIKKLDLDKI